MARKPEAAAPPTGIGKSSSLHQQQKRLAQWQLKLRKRERGEIISKKQKQKKIKTNLEEDKKKASDLEALEQLIKKARKEIKGPDLDPKLLAKKQKKVKKILHKMEYVNRFPSDEPYISLFDLPTLPNGKRKLLEERRETILKRVKKDLASLSKLDVPPVTAQSTRTHIKDCVKPDENELPKRDDFFLHSDEDEDESIMTQAPPLTAEDMKAKGKKWKK